MWTTTRFVVVRFWLWTDSFKEWGKTDNENVLPASFADFRFFISCSCSVYISSTLSSVMDVINMLFDCITSYTEFYSQCSGFSDSFASDIHPNNCLHTAGHRFPNDLSPFPTRLQFKTMKREIHLTCSAVYRFLQVSHSNKRPEAFKC